MINLETVKLEVKSLADFEFTPMTATEASNLTGAETGLFEQSGLYRVMSGSRGIIESVERVGDDMSSFQIPSMEEAIDLMVDGEDEEERETAAEYVGEFYFIDVDAEDPRALNFSYTEEEFDYFMMVN